MNLTRLIDKLKLIDFYEIIILTSLFVIMPLFLPTLYATHMLMYGLLTLSLNLVWGYGGLLSLGHPLFFGLGGYGVAITLLFLNPNPFFAILMGVSWSLAIGSIVGFVVLRGRVRGGYIALITLAFNVFVYHLFMGPLWEYTGSDRGQSLPPIGKWWLLNFSSKREIYYFILIISITVLVITKLLLKSKFGSLLIAASENPDKVSSLGYNSFLIRYLAFVLSVLIAGLAGSLFTIFNGYVGPDFISSGFNIPLIFMLMIGGQGTFFGPFIGSCLYLMFVLYLSIYTYIWEAIMGALAALVIIKFKGGIYRVLYLLIRGKYFDGPIR